MEKTKKTTNVDNSTNEDEERLVRDEKTDEGYVNKIWSKKPNKELILDSLNEGYDGIPKYE